MNIILVVIATIMMGFVYLKRRDLKYWLLTYIILAIGVFIKSFTDLTNPNSTAHLISRIFYVCSSFTLFIGIFKEYNETFLKEKLNNSNIRFVVISTLIVSPYIILLEIIIIICCGICTSMLVRIFLEKKTFTHAFLSLSIINILFSLIFSIIEGFGVEGIGVYSLGMNIIFFTTLLLTSIVALLDQKITNTLNEKIYLKDKYSHDLGNILHTISLSYDLIKIKGVQVKENKDLDNLIKNKIIEASDLVKDIRKL